MSKAGWLPVIMFAAALAGCDSDGDSDSGGAVAPAQLRVIHASPDAPAATAMLRADFPSLKIRFINVMVLFKLQPSSEHPLGLTDRDFDSLFTVNKPIIFNFHGYPWLIHRLA